jgi:hypothetical protein
MFESMEETYRKTAQQDSSLWKWITIDQEGTVKETLMTQEGVFNSMPEIYPRFFRNFGVVEMTLRQGNGTTITLKKVR